MAKLVIVIDGVTTGFTKEQLETFLDFSKDAILKIRLVKSHRDVNVADKGIGEVTSIKVKTFGIRVEE